MTVKMNAFVNAVLALHPSKCHSSQLLHPKVILKRLSRETIKKYTGVHDRLESPADEMFRTSHKSPPPVHDAASDVHEAASDAVDDEFDIQDSSSDISDELPDLNDPSFCEEVKRGPKMKKKKEIHRSDTKLMKVARKAFQHQAVRYKSSKQFMKTSKVPSKVKSTDSYSHNVQSKPIDHSLSSKTPPPLSDSDPLTPVKATPAQPEDTTEKKPDVDTAREGSGRSTVELLSLKLKESMARYVGEKKSSPVSEDVTNLRIESFQTLYGEDKKRFEEKEDCEDNQEENSGASDDSNSTVLFDANDIKDIYPVEFSQNIRKELSTGSSDFVTPVKENSNKKRKNSPLQNESTAVTKKVKRQDLDKEKDINQQPMVMIPVTISSPVSKPAVSTYSTPASTDPPVLHTNTVLARHTESMESSNVSNHADDATHLRKTVDIETSEKQSEVLRLSQNLTSNSNALIGKGGTPQKKYSYPRHEFQNECILIDPDTSQESEICSDENSSEIAMCKGVFEETPNNVNPLALDQNDEDECKTENSTVILLKKVNTSRNKKIEVQQKSSSSSSSVKEASLACNEGTIKTLKQLSQHFKELTTKRVQCEEKIRQVKEEYNNKLECLENDKKKIEVEISKMIIAMSERKDLSEEEESMPQEQPGSLVTHLSGNAEETVPELSFSAPESAAIAYSPQTPPGTPAVASNNEEKNERISINIIPAASIKNFGGKKSRSSQNKTPITILPKGKLNLAQTTVTSSAVEPTQTSRIASQVAISLSSDGLMNSTSTSSQIGSGKPKPSIFDKRSPPNAVLLPGQQHPVVTSRHTLAQAIPHPTTHAAQRRTAVPQMAKSTSKNLGSSQTQQMQNVSQVQQYIPMQQQQFNQYQQQQQQLLQQTQIQCQQPPQPQLVRLLQEQQLPQLQLKQQQKQRQQLHHQQVQFRSSKSCHPTLQQADNYTQHCQPMQAQPQNETTSLQGRVALSMQSAPVGANIVNSTVHMVPNFTLGTVISSEKNTAASMNRVIIAQPMPGNSVSLNTDNTSEKMAYIINAPSIPSTLITGANFQHNLQSVNPTINSKVTSLSLPSVSHAVTTVNPSDINLATSLNVHVNQSKEATLAAPGSCTTGGTSQECENDEPICKMCRSVGIFTCCNNVIYCSTACQGNDWLNHQEHCTNISTPATS